MRILGQVNRTLNIQITNKTEIVYTMSRYIRIGDISIHHDMPEGTRYIKNMICQRAT